MAFAASAAIFAMTVFAPQYFILVERGLAAGRGVCGCSRSPLAAFAASFLTARFSGLLAPAGLRRGSHVSSSGSGLALMTGVEAGSGIRAARPPGSPWRARVSGSSTRSWPRRL